MIDNKEENMQENKYAIVKVNNGFCPSKFEEINNNFVCDGNRRKKNDIQCKKCLYGLTREQYIRIIAQVLKRETGSDGLFMSDMKNFQESKSIIWDDVADEIVKALGLEKKHDKRRNK